MATCSWSIPYSEFCVANQTPAHLDLKAQSDDALVELVKRGETSAFSELVRRYQRYCMLKAYSILRNHDDAEDEVQTAWLKVWTHLASYRGQDSFDAWLSRIVSNGCLMRLRHSRCIPQVSVDEVFESEGTFRLEVIDQCARPDQVLGNDEVLDMLDKEIKGVPPLLREVLVMRDVRQRVIEDIAADLGISVPATKSRLMRARFELKKRLEKHYCKNGGTALLWEPSVPLTAFVRTE